MKERLKNYGFWVSLFSSIFIVIQAFGVKINVPYLNEILTSILGVLVVLGIINNPRDGSGYADTDKDGGNNLDGE